MSNHEWFFGRDALKAMHEVSLSAVLVGPVQDVQGPSVRLWEVDEGSVNPEPGEVPELVEGVKPVSQVQVVIPAAF